MVVLAGSVPAEVLAAVSRSMNVALIQPADSGDGGSGDGGDGMAAAVEALQRAGRATSPYALVPTDPLAAVAASWRAMWDVSRQQDPAAFEQHAARALAAWRAGRFELPDYYLVLAPETGNDDHGPDFHLGPLRSVRPHRVAFVAATEPAQQAVAVLDALGSLRHGPWWPGLDEVIDTARRFYPDSLAGGSATTTTTQPQTIPLQPSELQEARSCCSPVLRRDGPGLACMRSAGLTFHSHLRHGGRLTVGSASVDLRATPGDD
jgi:hypothetical protein